MWEPSVSPDSCPDGDAGIRRHRSAVANGASLAGGHPLRRPPLVWPPVGVTDVRDAIRRAEFAGVERLLPRGGTVVDLGAGPGLQTELIRGLGNDVVALDLPDGSYRPGPHMVWFDGVRLPLRTSSVDAIFSSHVLEHVEDIDGLFDELRRVLVPGGIAVHVMPTATWRMLGLVTRWKPIARAALRRGRGAAGDARTDAAPTGDAADVAFPADQRNLLTSILVPLPHGAHHSAVGELWAFSRFGWRRALADRGWSIDGPHPLGIAYSGTHAGPHPSMRARRRVALVIGSSSALWVLRPSSPTTDG